MWPFSDRKPKPATSDDIQNLRWMARNLSSAGFSFSGDKPEGTGMSAIITALCELADRKEKDKKENSNEADAGVV